MTLDLATYRERLKSYKTYGNQGAVDGMKKQILDNFYINPSYEDVIISLEERGVHIVQEGVRGLRLLCKPDEDILSGEYISWNKREYLCTHRFPDDKVQAKGTIQFCNHYLKWIDKDTDELIIRPCIEDARTLYTTGIKDEEVMEIPNGMVGIMLPAGKVTKRLDRDDRFVFNKTCYRVTFYDETNFEGLITLICQETGISHNDDMVNEIANRWIEVDGKLIDRLPHLDNQEPKPPIEEPETPDEDTYIIKVVDKQYESDADFVIWMGNYQTFQVTKIVNSEEVETEFEFELSEAVRNVTLTKENDNSCKISVAQNTTGKYDIELIVTDVETGEIVITQGIRVEGR